MATHRQWRRGLRAVGVLLPVVALLGLVLLFARNRGIDVSSSVLVGTSSTHRSMAGTLGCRYIGV